MGRLTKAARDEIGKLRREGFTQNEVAERLKVHVRTVRKYDPLHKAKPHAQHAVEERLEALEEALRTSWDWIDLLYSTMLRSPELRDILDNVAYLCPRCQGKLEYDEGGENTYVCSRCRHWLSLPYDWCYHCLSHERMNYVEAINDCVCPKCGARRRIPKDSATGSSATSE